MHKIKRNIVAIIGIFILCVFVFLGGFIAIAQNEMQINFSEELSTDLNEFDFLAELNVSDKWNKTFTYENGKISEKFLFGYSSRSNDNGGVSTVAFIPPNTDPAQIVTRAYSNAAFDLNIENAPCGISVRVDDKVALLDTGLFAAQPSSFVAYNDSFLLKLFSNQAKHFYYSFDATIPVTAASGLARINDKYYFAVTQPVKDGVQSTIWRVDEFAKKGEDTRTLESNGNIFSIAVPSGKFTKIVDLPIYAAGELGVETITALGENLVVTDCSDGAYQAKIFDENGELKGQKTLGTAERGVLAYQPNNGKDICFILSGVKAIGLRVENGKFTTEVSADAPGITTFATLSRNADKLMVVSYTDDMEFNVKIHDKSGQINAGVTNFGAQDDSNLLFNNYNNRYVQFGSITKSEVRK